MKTLVQILQDKTIRLEARNKELLEALKESNTLLDKSLDSNYLDNNYSYIIEKRTIENIRVIKNNES